MTKEILSKYSNREIHQASEGLKIGMELCSKVSLDKAKELVREILAKRQKKRQKEEWMISPPKRFTWEEDGRTKRI